MRKKIYFASDFHLGLDLPDESSRAREAKIIRWLDAIFPDTKELYLLGDLFDYWYEYNEVVPRGHTRFLAKLAQFSDAGIPLHIFTGNHDIWMFDYLEKELGATVHRDPITINLDQKQFYLAHGDGLGPGDHGYKLIKKIFRNRINQWLFTRLHPNFAVKIMRYFSGRSRAGDKNPSYLGPEKEWLIQFCEQQLESSDLDYFIMGHRHLPIDYRLNKNNARYINLGDMITYNTYACFDGKELKLLSFENDSIQIFGNT